MTPHDISEERWMPVAGYESLYEVSSAGRVRSLPRPSAANMHGKRCRSFPGQILEPITQAKGYQMVSLRALGVARWFLVHRLVAAAFIGKPDSDHEVNHKDGIKTNNAAENLEWVTRRENHLHRCRVLQKSRRAAVCADHIAQAVGIWFPSMAQCAQSFGWTPGNVSTFMAKRWRRKGWLLTRCNVRQAC
jgi:hypothetical protein